MDLSMNANRGNGPKPLQGQNPDFSFGEYFIFRLFSDFNFACHFV